MADAEGAARSANETGATSSPQAELHLRLAREELASAKQLMADQDNKHATSMLLRARADAELALAEAREMQARTESQQAQQRVNAQAGGQ